MTPALVGRDAELSRALETFASARWITIVGPPGVGKTSLARAVAAAAQHAAVWVDARGLGGPEEVLEAALRALDAERAPGDAAAGALARAFDTSDALVVIDGVGLAVTGLSGLLAEALDASTGGRLLVTSLSTGHQSAERVIRVAPLPVPAAGEPLSGPVVDLFCERVLSAGGMPVDLVAHEAEVRRLMTSTAGLPLLIEQVAVQSSLLGLGGATPAATLGETLDASYALLDHDHQRAYRCVGALDAPVSLDVLAAVLGTDAADAARVAAGLTRRSLTEVRPDGRFDMLSPVRTHAKGHLVGAEEIEIDAALFAWADAAVPEHVNAGASDEPWLRELSAVRRAVLRAADSPERRAEAHSLANRTFSALYTAMRTRDALEILTAVLDRGEVPALVGSMVARRAGVAASELHGTYEGMSLLARADEYAISIGDLAEQAKTASIRAEMHLDAGDLSAAEREALRAIELDGPGGSIVRQATRTLADVHVSAGRLGKGMAAATAAIPVTAANSERWISLSARTLLAKVALEQGRIAEATAATRAVLSDAEKIAEDRVGLLAEVMLREVDPTWECREVDREALPWAVRLPVLAQDARALFASGDVRRAAGLAADVAALADAAHLGRDAVEARLLLGRALLADDRADEAITTLLTALERANAMPMALRVADVLDALASVATAQGNRVARDLAATAATIRAPHRAQPWGYAADFAVEPARSTPAGWLVDGLLSAQGVAAVANAFASHDSHAPSVLDALTPAERQIADRVADGLTSRKIAEELFVSPRTVDAHLTNIYRKFEINTRAKLAAIVVDNR